MPFDDEIHDDELAFLASATLLIGDLKAISDFGSRIRGLVSGYWRGDIDEFSFVSSMVDAVTRGITQAWGEGAASCGISPSEFSQRERISLLFAIATASGPVVGFARQIAANTRAMGAKLAPHLSRAALWTNQYNSAKSQAQTMACADAKMAWRLGPTERHCTSCLNYDGRVYRASTWAKWGIRPQMRSLRCGGWRCLCTLSVTTAPLNRGRPPGP